MARQSGMKWPSDPKRSNQCCVAVTRTMDSRSGGFAGLVANGTSAIWLKRKSSETRTPLAAAVVSTSPHGHRDVAQSARQLHLWESQHKSLFDLEQSSLLQRSINSRAVTISTASTTKGRVEAAAMAATVLTVVTATAAESTVSTVFIWPT